MEATRERPTPAALTFLINALGNAGRLKEMDAVLPAFAAHGHTVSLSVLTRLIFHHGRLKDLDGLMLW